MNVAKYITMNVILQTVLFRQYKEDANIYDVIMQHSDCESLEKTLFSCMLCDYYRPNIKSLDGLSKSPNHTSIKRKNKFQMFYDIIWIHPFLSTEEKERLLLFFCKIQRTYHAFLSLKKIWVFKRAIVAVDQDLFLNPIDQCHPKTFVCLQDGKKYYFILSDLMKIMDRALTQHDHFDLEAYYPKNPYTNLPFSKSMMYNFYFYINQMGILIPTLFHLFFLEDFNINNFVSKYDSIILKQIIKNYVFHANSTNFLHSILDMIDENKYTCQWAIDSDFPDDKLMDIMRPYAYIYYLILYGKLSETRFMEMSSFLYHRLFVFWKFNPNFGKKIYNITNTSSSEKTFFDKHLPFSTRNL